MKNIDGIEIEELKRLIANLHSDYVYAGYHLEHYLIETGIPANTQPMLRDIVLNLNGLRASTNALFNLLQPLVDPPQK
jgi:hypothetical protein